MAYRLGDSVISGEIFNTTNYSVRGWLKLRGRDYPLLLQLTGNCSPDLAGWHFRFQSRDAFGNEDADRESVELDALATQQIGPTGTMTVRPVCANKDPAESANMRRSGRQPPCEGKRCLHLEWFGQNGRVVVELIDPVLELIEFQGLKATGRCTGTGMPLDDKAFPTAPPATAASSIRDAEHVADVDDLPGVEEAADVDAFFSDPEAPDEDEDPYHLFPEDLQLQLDLAASQTDSFLNHDEDKPRVIRELELMDDLIENSPGVPLTELFDNPVKCPLPDQLNDEQVETALKSLLAELALFGVSLEICEHFTAREAYRLLLEEICPEERAYPELRHTQWVQHYSTSDYCEQCQAEFDREFEEYNRQLEEECGEDAAEEDDPDDALPF